MGGLPKRVILAVNVHQYSKQVEIVKLMCDTYVTGKKKKVDISRTKKPRPRKTGSSLQTPKKQRAPRGFLLGLSEAPLPRPKG